jgi:signal transduction histidine kinase
MKKLDPVKNDIKRLEHGEIKNLSDDVPAEILPVIQEFNRILILLGQRLDRSRNALGNLAHALKGPLNLLTQYYDTAEEGMDIEQVNQAKTQTERIRQLMERELKRARLAGKDMPVQRFNPKNNLPDLISVLNQIHQNKALDIQYMIADEVPSFGDLEDMHELLGNLLDNACKWATSKVRCILTGHDEIHIIIEDDGRGLSIQELEQLSQRGVRLDETVEGHGLGLSIAKDIVKLYGGQLLFSPSQELGGLKIQIILPQV